MDLIAPSSAQNIVRLMFVHGQMALVQETVLLAITVISVVKHVPTTVISKNVTNRVDNV